MEPEKKQVTPQLKEQVQHHTLLLEIKETLTILDRAVINKETRTIVRITKNVRKYRNVIKPHHLIALHQAVGSAVPQRLRQLSSFNKDFNQKLQLNKSLSARISKTLELQGFIRILSVLVYWREGAYSECLSQVQSLISKIIAANRRNLDSYSALLYHYFNRIHQKLGSENTIRQHLLQAYNRSCVRQDEIGQSTLLNILLRGYLRSNQLEAAHNLIQKCTFPQNKSNNQFCKFLYYSGRVRSVRRQYGQALQRLNQAIRKSPDVAKGFKIQCQKVAIVVQLLTGQIPNRQIFSDATIFTHVYPYYKLIQVVLEGQLGNFTKVVQFYKATYIKDGLYTMILRLNQIVLRIGLRKISIAYSKISLKDVGRRLNIPHQDVEFVVAKALRDGIIKGLIDHEAQTLQVEGDQNIYVTHEPQHQMDKRIRYCLNLYHEVQKAITYPDMKRTNDQFKEEELDASQLMNLLDFDDDM